MNFHNILIIKQRNIGDVLLVTPVVRELHRVWPEARISLLVNEGTEEMVKYHPAVEEVIVYPRSRFARLTLLSRVVAEVRFLWELRQQRYDLVIVTTASDRGIITARFVGAPRRIGYRTGKRLMDALLTDRIPVEQQATHTVYYNLRLLEPLGVVPYHTRVDLTIPTAAADMAKEIILLKGLSNFIHIHPTSRWMFKALKPELWGELINYLLDKHELAVVLTAADDERELDYIKRVLRCLPEENAQVVNLAGKLTLLETAAISRLALGFVGVDTAPMHMAAAVNTPVFAFFGPSKAFYWGPFASGDKAPPYVKRNGLQQSGPHMVYQQSRPCIPCGKDGCDGSKISQCLHEIAFEDIVAPLDQWLYVQKHPDGAFCALCTPETSEEETP